MGEIDAPLTYITMKRLISILDGEHELMRWRLSEILHETIYIPPGRRPDPVTPEMVTLLIQNMNDSPYAVILHKDPPRPEPYMVHRLIKAAREICHKNLEYLDQLEHELENMPAAEHAG